MDVAGRLLSSLFLPLFQRERERERKRERERERERKLLLLKRHNKQTWAVTSKSFTDLRVPTHTHTHAHFEGGGCKTPLVQMPACMGHRNPKTPISATEKMRGNRKRHPPKKERGEDDATFFRCSRERERRERRERDRARKPP